MKKLNFLLSIFFILLVSSCVNEAGRNSKGLSDEENALGGTTTSTSNTGSGNTSGNTAVPYGDGDVTGTNTLIDLESGSPELRHIVDPFDGTFKTKVTIPKNFTGRLNLSGLNITSLRDKHVSVRFNFGRGLEPVTIGATIGRAPGITPQTDIEVLMLYVENRPFENIRLLYDLYDYNDYRDEDGIETEEPTDDPRNGGLYCRGLDLQYDPTFDYSVSNQACDAAGEKCLYSYAKILDSGLIRPDGITINPSEPQMDVTGSGYNSEATSQVLNKCLPDNNNVGQFESLLRTDILSNVGLNTSGTSRVVIDSEVYTYNGPFRPVAYSDWQIKNQAVVSPVNSATAPTGLFQFSYNTFDSSDPESYADGGFRSMLFPRSGKVDLVGGVEYFGASTSDPFGTKVLTSMVSSGSSEYINGCSMRIFNTDDYSGESIASCNVTATIQIITKDSNGNDQVLAETKDVKLQLSRASNVNYEGKEVLYSAMKTCSTSSMCGAGECCFNSRCWSKSLVSQCLEDTPDSGNFEVGAACTSDFQCSTLCCNPSKGACDVHVNTELEKVLCSKSPGQTCVSKEYCRQENIRTCFIVKTGLDQQGTQTCALRCYNIPTHGDCENGICIPPVVPPVPTFDPTNPDCSTAIDPPTNLD